MQDTIAIEVTDPGEARKHEDEVWLTVSGSDPLPDWPTVREAAEAKLGLRLMPRPVAYFPSWGGPDDDYEELWVSRKVSE